MQRPTIINETQPELLARSKLRKLWQPGDLFHVTARFPRKKHEPPIDRLAGILRHGLVAPGCSDGDFVVSDLNLLVVNCSFPYDQFVFLHRFGRLSPIYTICERNRFAVSSIRSFP